MVIYAQHPTLTAELAEAFRKDHTAFFRDAKLISTNNGQVVKSFRFKDQQFMIKRYPTHGFNAQIRSLLGLNRPMNAFRFAALLPNKGIKCPAHLFVARHIGFGKGVSYLIMRKSPGTILTSVIAQNLDAPLSEQVVTNIANLTKQMQMNGYSHGDLHAGNLFVLEDQSIEVIDLDNFSKRRNRHTKDRARLLRSFNPYPSLQEQLNRKLQETT